MTRPSILHAFAAAAALACLAAPRPSHAQAFISGAQLARTCVSRAVPDENACSGYVAGALDVIAGTPDLRKTICPPNNTKLVVLREAVGRFGQQSPNDTKGTGVDLIIAMLAANYPCQAK